MKKAVLEHDIMWTDLAARVSKNEHVELREAEEEVAELIDCRYCSLPVAVALIDLIVEGARSR